LTVTARGSRGRSRTRLGPYVVSGSLDGLEDVGELEVGGVDGRRLVVVGPRPVAVDGPERQEPDLLLLGEGEELLGVAEGEDLPLRIVLPDHGGRPEHGPRRRVRDAEGGDELRL